MATQRSVCSFNLCFLFACFATFGAVCKTADAQACVGCVATADLEEPIPTGEWLLTKEVTEVNVSFVVSRKADLPAAYPRMTFQFGMTTSPPAPYCAFEPSKHCRCESEWRSIPAIP